MDHSTVQKWVVYYSPQLEKAFRQRKKAVGSKCTVMLFMNQTQGEIMQQLQQIRIVVADSAIGKLFYYDKSNRSLEETSVLEHVESKLKASELKADEPGRYQKSLSPNEGTYTETTDPKTEESEHFAKELAEIMSKEFHENKFGKLLFIAPGNFQAKFKQKIHKQLFNNTTFVDKDYTKASNIEVEAHIKELVKDINVF